MKNFIQILWRGTKRIRQLCSRHVIINQFLLDLLSSDDVYLSGYGREEIKVIPSAEEFSYRVRPDAPQNVTLKLTLAEKESNWTGEITESGYRKPRGHSKECSKQFN